MLSDLFFGERHPFDGGRGAVELFTKLSEATFDHLRNENTGGIMVTKLVDETFFASIGGSGDIAGSHIELISDGIPFDTRTGTSY